MDSLDDVDQFHLDREKILLDDAGYSESDSLEELSEDETEVLPLTDNEKETGSENEADPYYVSEDDEQNESDEQLATRAWGSSKKTFYSQEEIGLSSSDEAEDFEEREAIELQDKMASALSEADFLSLRPLGEEKNVQQELEQVQIDLSKLTKGDKLKLVDKGSPELAPMLDSLRASLGLITSLQHTSNTLPLSRLDELKLQTHYCYCVNGMFYLLLKSSKDTTQSHPVFSRLLSLKQLISQLESIQPTPKDTKHKSAGVDEQLPTERAQWDALEYYQAVKQSKSKKRKVAFEDQISEEEFEDEVEGKRPISYQISRNKGLTPRRSKEQRNPRVKHRKKFKKALQKRKGQVLPVTTEMSRYAGEATGIRSAVSRSVKIK